MHIYAQRCHLSSSSMKHLPAPTCPFYAPGASSFFPSSPCPRWSSSLLPLPTSQSFQVLPHQSLEFSCGRGRGVGEEGLAGQQNHYPNISFKKSSGWRNMASLCGGEAQRRGWGARWPLGSAEPEADGVRGGSLQRGAACLTKEREASPQAGPLHAGLSCSVCSAPHAPGLTLLL